MSEFRGKLGLSVVWFLVTGASLYVAFWPPWHSAGRAGAIAQLVQQEGLIQHRPMDESLWTLAAKDQQFTEGTVVATGPTAQATIRFVTGRILRIEPNTQLVLSLDDSFANREGYIITLLKGGISTSTPPAYASTTSPGEPVERSFSIAAANKKVRLDSPTDEVEVFKTVTTPQPRISIKEGKPLVATIDPSPEDDIVVPKQRPENKSGTESQASEPDDTPESEDPQLAEEQKPQTSDSEDEEKPAKTKPTKTPGPADLSRNMARIQHPTAGSTLWVTNQRDASAAKTAVRVRLAKPSTGSPDDSGSITHVVRLESSSGKTKLLGTSTSGGGLAASVPARPLTRWLRSEAKSRFNGITVTLRPGVRRSAEEGGTSAFSKQGVKIRVRSLARSGSSPVTVTLGPRRPTGENAPKGWLLSSGRKRNPQLRVRIFQGKALKRLEPLMRDTRWIDVSTAPRNGRKGKIITMVSQGRPLAQVSLNSAGLPWSRLGSRFGADLVFNGPRDAFLGAARTEGDLQAALTQAKGTLFALTGEGLVGVEKRLLRKNALARNLVVRVGRSFFRQPVEILAQK